MRKISHQGLTQVWKTWKVLGIGFYSFVFVKELHNSTKALYEVSLCQWRVTTLHEIEGRNGECRSGAGNNEQVDLTVFRSGTKCALSQSPYNNNDNNNNNTRPFLFSLTFPRLS